MSKKIFVGLCVSVVVFALIGALYYDGDGIAEHVRIDQDISGQDDPTVLVIDETPRLLEITSVDDFEGVSDFRSAIRAVDSKGNKIYVAVPSGYETGEVRIEENHIPNPAFLREYPPVTKNYIRVIYPADWNLNSTQKHIVVISDGEFNSVFAFVEENGDYPKLIPFVRDDDSSEARFRIKTKSNDFMFAAVFREDV